MDDKGKIKSTDLHYCEYEVWEENGIIKGEIKFSQSENLAKDFQKLLAENIKLSNKLEFVSYIYPYSEKKDPAFLLTNKDSLPEVESKIKAYENDNQAKEEALSLVEMFPTFLFEAYYDYDYDYVFCYSKIHNKNTLMEEIRKAAAILKVELKFVDREEIKRKQKETDKIFVFITIGAIIIFIIIRLIIFFSK
ncbi:MAG: hypothetical protein PHQ96_04895 [Candidatus Omnitrophica bacterium]|nr:hypothetical protein [Candidatus Omnitrophota bacterium]